MALNNYAGGPWSQAFLNHNYDQGRGSRPLHGSKEGLWPWTLLNPNHDLSLFPSLSSFGYPATIRTYDVPPPVLFFSL